MKYTGRPSSHTGRPDSRPHRYGAASPGSPAASSRRYPAPRLPEKPALPRQYLFQNSVKPGDTGHRLHHLQHVLGQAAHRGPLRLWPGHSARRKLGWSRGDPEVRERVRTGKANSRDLSARGALGVCPLLYAPPAAQRLALALTSRPHLRCDRARAVAPGPAPACSPAAQSLPSHSEGGARFRPRAGGGHAGTPGACADPGFGVRRGGEGAARGPPGERMERPSGSEAEPAEGEPEVKKRRLLCVQFASVANCDPAVAQCYLAENDWAMEVSFVARSPSSSPRAGARPSLTTVCVFQRALNSFFEPPAEDGAAESPPGTAAGPECW